MTNGPPSSGQQVITGRRSSRTSEVTTSRTGPVATPLRADLQQIEADVAGAPQLRRRRRQDRLGQVDDALDERERPRAERELGAPRGAEQVGDERKVRALHVGEQQRRPAGGDHAAMDLGGFEVRIDRRADLDEIPIAAELIEERSQIAENINAIRSRVVHDAPAEHRHARCESPSICRPAP